MDPYHLNSLNGLATAYALGGKLDKSLDTFEQLITLDPSNPQYYFNKGSVLQKEGRVEDAEVAYEEAIRLDPNEQRSLFNLGTLYENRGEWALAKPYYERAKRVNITNPIGLESIHRIEDIERLLAAKVVEEAEEKQHEAQEEEKRKRKKRKKTKTSAE